MEGEKMEVYTDGSYNPLTNKCTYGYIFVDNDIIRYQYKNTNNDGIGLRNEYAELKAIILAIKKAKRLNIKITLYTDYLSASDILAKDKMRYSNTYNGFRKRFKDFMGIHKELYELRYIKGHSNNKYNNFVDKLCKHEGNGRIEELALQI
jgi:ribonuclease HI